MEHPGFFTRGGPFPLSQIACRVGAETPQGVDGHTLIEDVKALHAAGPADLSFCDNPRYLALLTGTRAAACLVSSDNVPRVPDATVALASRQPYRAFALAMQLFYADARHPKAAAASPSRLDAGLVDPTAEIGVDVTIEPGAVVGSEARIGRGTTIAAGAVVGYRVHIGCDGYVGPGASVTHALIGDRVILHAGVRIGQDGFGFAMGPEGHIKIPQIGRVIIGDDVEIGANSTVDRGALGDTVVGSGTKIDNLVQIAHNVVIGKHCVIVAQSGVAGSAQLGDFVVMGAHSGVVGHVKVGSGAQIAGMAHVKDDVPPGERMGGTPAKPFREWARETAMLKRLSRGRPRQ